MHIVTCCKNEGHSTNKELIGAVKLIDKIIKNFITAIIIVSIIFVIMTILSL